MKKLSAVRLARCGIIAALYAALCYVFAPFSYHGLEFRVSECLTVLPLFYWEAIPGLTIGCFLANLLSTPLDMVFGPVASLIAALLTYFAGKYIKNKVGKVVLGEMPPIIVNAIVVPFTYLALTELKEAYFIEAAKVGLGQFTVIAVLGSLLYFAVERLRKRNISCML